MAIPARKEEMKPIKYITGRELIAGMEPEEIRHERAKVHAIVIVTILGIVALGMLATFILIHQPS